MKPFADSARQYLAAGWSPLPLPAREKQPPPTGYTGYAGRYVEESDIALWLSQRKGTGNIAVRAPEDVLGIDIDAYGDKVGAETLEQEEERLGALPATWRSTSRHSDWTSGIRWFRVRPGRAWADRVGPAIEVVHQGHRYGVVWPSIHPDTRAEYGWYGPDGVAANGLPRVAELPELPKAWQEELDRGPVSDRAAKADLSDGDVGSFLASLEGEPCPYVERILTNVADELGVAQSRYDTTRDAALALIRAGEQGHQGAGVGLETLEGLYVDAIAGDRNTSTEWARLVTGGVALVLGKPTKSQDRGCCRVLSEGQVDVGNQALAAAWLREVVGREGSALAGLFRRGGALVHTPHIGQDGYDPLSEVVSDEDGPAQVREMTSGALAARVDVTYDVVKFDRDGLPRPWLFPLSSADRVIESLDVAHHLRPLRGVTHTPMLRKDGTVLDEPGYDEATCRLFLPEDGLAVEPVPKHPTPAEVAKARDLLLSMVAEFPFNTVHDRANYLTALLTPLLRELVPPPYKMVVINAHQRGSGKSLLAGILRTIHGGALRGDVPEDGAEFRKQITALLHTTTAPVVQFDNVRRLDSTRLDALLTSDTWSDRPLGKTADVVARNDRLWVATGNNVVLGGDLTRRVLWVTIDPNTPRPEERTDFAIPDLEAWVRAHRGELLHALLTLVRAWVSKGRPVGPLATTDSFAEWLRVANGVLSLAGIEGTAGHADTVRQTESDEDEEWGSFLLALHAVFGEKAWSAKEAVVVGSGLDDVWPEFLRGRSGFGPSPQALGNALRNRLGRWAGGLAVRDAGKDRTNTRLWRLEESAEFLL